MKRQRSHLVVQAVAIARNHWDVPVRVALRPYVRFSLNMSRDLDKLVARWAHTAAPNADARESRR